MVVQRNSSGAALAPLHRTVEQTAKKSSILACCAHLRCNLITKTPTTYKRQNWAFSNYVDKILPIIDLPIPCRHLWQNSFTVLGKNLHTVEISSTNYLPRLDNVVFEWPQMKRWGMQRALFGEGKTKQKR